MVKKAAAMSMTMHSLDGAPIFRVLFAIHAYESYVVELNRIQKICHFIRNLGRLLQDIKCERRPTQIMAKPTDVEEK